MQSDQERKQNLIRQRSLRDPKERERILMQYGGVFKNNIPEFAKLIRKVKPVKNYAE